jgi:hypothetical protein
LSEFEIDVVKLSFCVDRLLGWLWRVVVEGGYEGWLRVVVEGGYGGWLWRVVMFAEGRIRFFSPSSLLIWNYFSCGNSAVYKF